VPDERATLSAVTKLEHSTTWVWVWGSEPPAFSIGFEEPSTPADSGYTVLFADAPDPEDVAENGEHPAIGVWCSHCLLEEHPEVARGLVIAHEFGAADLDDDGVWVGRHLSPAIR
jgi:hypothetical protein